MAFAAFFKRTRDYVCAWCLVRRVLSSAPVRTLREVSRTATALTLSLCVLAAGAPASAQVKEARRVLIFYVSGSYTPLSNLVDQGIRDTLENSPFRIEFYREYLDAAAFPDASSQLLFRDFYIHKYENRRPDVIVAVGPEPLKFLTETHRTFFEGVPVVFCLPNRMQGDFTVDPDFTGVVGDIAPGATVAAALRLRPNTKHVAVVSGSTPFDLQQNDAVKEQLKPYENRLEISYLSNLAMPVLLERLKHLPADSIILLGAFGRDATGDRFTTDESGPMIVAAANAPIFSLNDRNIGHGEVGGDVSNAVQQGRIAGSMARQILNGERAKDIPPVRDATTYMFDWQALKQWGLKEKNLPPGSLVINRRPTLWEAHQWLIVGGVLLILFEALLISALLWQWLRRRAAERELSIAYDRLRMTVKAGKCAGWEWDVKTGKDRWFGDLQSVIGVPSETYSGTVEEFRGRVHPEDRELFWNAVVTAKETRHPYAAEFRVIQADGSARWIQAHGRFYYTPNGEAERMLGMSVDITERKTVEAELRSLTGRLIGAQEEERRRIAREIHDDYNQRLALLSAGLANFAADANMPGELKRRLRETRERISELGVDLHGLSHGLHSSTLENLGLVAGLRGLAREFSTNQHVSVEFVDVNIPHIIPQDVALCLFRIAQEGLRNIKRHSSAESAEMRLEGTEDGLHLMIADRGKGFDPSLRSGEFGIGIQSMRERLRMLGGTLEIHSKPMQGTKLDAWLSFRILGQRAS